MHEIRAAFIAKIPKGPSAVNAKKVGEGVRTLGICSELLGLAAEADRGKLHWTFANAEEHFQRYNVDYAFEL